MDRRSKALAGALAAAMIAVALPACGDDDVKDAANDLQNQADQAREDLSKKSDDLQQAIEEGAPKREIEEKRRELREQFERQRTELEGKSKELQEQIEDQLP
jgi:uncharacterized phage infection (PIP) family protein YhgE